MLLPVFHFPFSSQICSPVDYQWEPSSLSFSSSLCFPSFIFKTQNSNSQIRLPTDYQWEPPLPMTFLLFKAMNYVVLIPKIKLVKGSQLPCSFIIISGVFFLCTRNSKIWITPISISIASPSDANITMSSRESLFELLMVTWHMSKFNLEGELGSEHRLGLDRNFWLYAWLSRDCGSIPDKWFAGRLSKLSFKLFISTEIEPENLLLDKSRVVSTGSHPIESGIEPVNLLLLRLKW
jgi:hypothetical protein